MSIAFSDHLAHLVKVQLPEDMVHSVSPRSRPFFKTSPEVVRDDTFKKRLQYGMKNWLEVKERGLAVVPWWDIYWLSQALGALPLIARN